MRTTPAIARAIILTAMLISLIAAAPIIKREWIAARFEVWTARDFGGPAPLPWEPPPSDALCGRDCPPGALAASGVRLTNQATRTNDPNRRTALLDAAETRLSRAVAAEPVNGETWAWLAYTRWLKGGERAGLLLALTKSYATAPFLLREGPWRARTAALNWPHLDAQTQSRLVDETVWLRDADPNGFDSIPPAFLYPDATRALAQGLARPRRLIAHR
jgi:hypothetical protein